MYQDRRPPRFNFFHIVIKYAAYKRRKNNTVKPQNKLQIYGPRSWLAFDSLVYFICVIKCLHMLVQHFFAVESFVFWGSGSLGSCSLEDNNALFFLAQVIKVFSCKKEIRAGLNCGTKSHFLAHTASHSVCVCRQNGLKKVVTCIN